MAKKRKAKRHPQTGKNKVKRHGVMMSGDARRQMRIKQEVKGCPTPTKTPFANETEAREALRRAVKGGTVNELRRAYRCGCGYWHLTKMAQLSGGTSRVIELPAAVALELADQPELANQAEDCPLTAP